ncbi:MAG: phytanoyl-CoA dioxygenase family protein [Planctomycetota bacterium]|nr:phytanoyl-CoA dioxygenase family protein [Planctomycetota bacterium]
MSTAAATPAAPPAVTPEQRFLFDLQGFVILRQAIEPELVADLLAAVRRCEARDYDDAAWKAKVTVGKPSSTKDVGEGSIRLNGLPRLDPAFDRLIAHPAVLPLLRDFQGDPQLINTWSITKSRGCPSGWWHAGIPPSEYQVVNGAIRTPMLNVVTMLTDNTAGDGCLIVQPGSHKKNFALPGETYGKMGRETPGCIEVTGKAGDVVLFTEALHHNGDDKKTDGLRTNLYFNHMHVQRNVVMYDPVNAHHYWLPPEVRARFGDDAKQLTRWMVPMTID